MYGDPTCEHGTPASLSSDIQHLSRFGANPDCLQCPECNFDGETCTHGHL